MRRGKGLVSPSGASPQRPLGRDDPAAYPVVAHGHLVPAAHDPLGAGVHLALGGLRADDGNVELFGKQYQQSVLVDETIFNQNPAQFSAAFFLLGNFGAGNADIEQALIAALTDEDASMRPRISKCPERRSSSGR